MLYVFSVLIIATLLLSVFSVDELTQMLAGLSVQSSVALVVLVMAVILLVWRARRKK